MAYAKKKLKPCGHITAHINKKSAAGLPVSTKPARAATMRYSPNYVLHTNATVQGLCLRQNYTGPHKIRVTLYRMRQAAYAACAKCKVLPQ